MAGNPTDTYKYSQYIMHVYVTPKNEMCDTHPCNNRMI